MIAKVYKVINSMSSKVVLKLYWINLEDVTAIGSLDEDSKFFEIYFRNGNIWNVCCNESNPYAELLTKWQKCHG